MIGIFDSGSGGLSVLRAIRHQLPRADILYFGDTAHMPYGNKSVAELELLTVAGANKLFDAGADIIVWACNSVSTAVVRPKLANHEFDARRMVEMVGPCIAGLVESGVSVEKVAILATPATIRSGIYASACANAGLKTISIASPNLASAIEGRNFAAVKLEIKRMLAAAAREHAHTIALCCTHYPLVQELFAAEIIVCGYDMKLFDPAEAVAAAVVRHYKKQGAGTTKFVLSQESESFWKWVEVIQK